MQLKPLLNKVFMLEMFFSRYETANGISAHQEGHQKDHDLQEVRGSYSYTAPDGQLITVEYVANENGYQAVGSHIHGIPDAIVKSLQFNAEQEAMGIVDDGLYRSPHPAHSGNHDNYFEPEVIDARQFLTPRNQYLEPPKQFLNAPKSHIQHIPPRDNHYESALKVNRQYLAPRKSIASEKSGYHY